MTPLRLDNLHGVLASSAHSVRTLARRISIRGRRFILRGIGQRIVGVVPVAPGLSLPSYPQVLASSFCEDDGTSTIKPKHLPEDSADFLQPFRSRCDTVLLDISNSGFSFRNRLVLDPEPRALFTPTISADGVLTFRRYAPRSIRRLSGTVAYLSNTWAENYYHWMQLTLPLLRLYQCMAAGTAIQWYYVGEGYSSRAQAETLARANIRQEQVVREACSGDRMLAAIYSHSPQHGGVLYRDQRGHGFVRSLFPATRDDSLPQRIFLLRGPVRTRRILNEGELLRLLRRFGFVAVTTDGMTVAQQAQLFANAKIIVAGHGAALTNLLFAQEGTVVVELFPPNIREASFFAAATHSRAEYYYVIGISAGRAQDFIVPVTKLAAVLNMAGVR